MLDRPDSGQLEDFVLHEGVDNSELLKKIIRAWGNTRHQGRAKMGKRIVYLEKPTHLVKEGVKEVMLPFHPSLL